MRAEMRAVLKERKKIIEQMKNNSNYYTLCVGDSFWLNGKLIHVMGVNASETQCWNSLLGEFNGPTTIPENLLEKN